MTEVTAVPKLSITTRMGKVLANLSLLSRMAWLLRKQPCSSELRYSSMPRQPRQELLRSWASPRRSKYSLKRFAATGNAYPSSLHQSS